MVIKEGYKKTEIGLIPEDWDVKNIGDVCQIFGRIGFRGYTVNDIVKKEQGAITISPSNIYGDKINFAKCTYISWFKYHESPEIKIYNGDVLLVKTGSTSGKTALVKNLNEKATINPQLVVLKKILINNFLLSYIMSYEIVQNQIISTIVGGAIPTLSQKQVLSFKIPLPPSPAEQTAIATALSDADGLITGLEKLIAKKRNIKQGAMQQLLQPKEGWEVKKLGEFDFDISDGNYSSKYPKSSEFKQNGIPFIRANNIKKTTVIDNDLRYISNELHSELLKGHLKKNDILITTRGEIGQIAIVPDEFIGANINAQIVRINTNNKINKNYFAYFLLKSETQETLLSFQTGSALKQLPVGKLKELNINYPLAEEQTRIATILSDMDAELSALEQKLEKYKKVKLGMMQELLTGKTRLV